MKRNILLAVLLLVLVTGCDVKSNSQSISVKIQASGEVEVEPDIATFVVTASCVNKKINISNTCTKNKVTSIFKIFDKSKIDKKDFHSSGVSLNKEYYWKKNTQVFRGYRSSVSMEVVLRDLTKLDKLLGTIMTHTNLSMSGLSYSHSKINELKNDTYIKALENAKILAEKIKNEVGGNSIKIVEINNTGAPLTTVGGAEAKILREADKYEAQSINMNIGTLVLRNNIRVQYRIVK